MMRQYEFIEIAAICLGAIACHGVVTALVPDPPPAVQAEDPAVAVVRAADPATSTIVFTRAEPRERVILLERRDGTRYLVERGAEIPVSGAGLDARFDAPGFDGPIDVSFVVFQDGKRAFTGGVAGRRARMTLSESGLRVFSW